jgi:hypothetical protein
VAAHRVHVAAHRLRAALRLVRERIRRRTGDDPRDATLGSPASRAWMAAGRQSAAGPSARQAFRVEAWVMMANGDAPRREWRAARRVSGEAGPPAGRTGTGEAPEFEPQALRPVSVSCGTVVCRVCSWEDHHDITESGSRQRGANELAQELPVRPPLRPRLDFLHHAPQVLDAGRVQLADHGPDQLP